MSGGSGALTSWFHGCSAGTDVFSATVLLQGSLVAGGYTSGDCTTGVPLRPAGTERQDAILYRVPLAADGTPDKTQAQLIQITAKGSSAITAIAPIAGTTDVVVCGTVSGGFLGGYAPSALAVPPAGFGGSDMFAMRFDATLQKVWSWQLGSAADESCAGVATNDFAGAVVVGATGGALLQPLIGPVDMVMVSLNIDNGNQLTALQDNPDPTGARSSLPVAVAARLSADVVVVGKSEIGALSPSVATSMTDAGNSRDVYVRLYSFSPNPLEAPVLGWTAPVSTDAADDPAALAVDQDTGRVYVTGSTRGTFDGKTKRTADSIDAFIVELDGYSGTLDCVRQVKGSELDDDMVAIALDADNVVIGGGTKGSIPPFGNQGKWDAILMSFDRTSGGCGDYPDRAWQGGSAADDQARSIVLQGADTVTFVGFTYGDLGGAHLGGPLSGDNIIASAQLVPESLAPAQSDNSFALAIGLSAAALALVLIGILFCVLWRCEHACFSPKRKARLRAKLCCCLSPLAPPVVEDEKPRASIKAGFGGLKPLPLGHKNENSETSAVASDASSGVPADVYFREHSLGSTAATVREGGPYSARFSGHTNTTANSSATSRADDYDHGGADVASELAQALAEFEIRTSDVRITGKLGEGNFGTVFRGRWQGQRVAVKRLKHAATRDLRHEVGALLRLRHPNVAFFYGATPPPDPLLVTELLWGSLYTLLHKMGPVGTGAGGLEGPIALRVVRDICRGMAYIHSRNVLHRDISSSNVLLTGGVAELTALVASNSEEPVAKLCDFGLSRPLDAGLTAAAGNLFYCAPEVYRGEQATAKSDVYSYALVAWEAYSGKVPFNDQKTPQLAAYSACAKGVRPPIDASIPPGIAFLMQDCWNADGQQRPTAEVVLAALDDMHRARATRADIARQDSGANDSTGAPPDTSTNPLDASAHSDAGSPVGSDFNFPSFRDDGGSAQDGAAAVTYLKPSAYEGFGKMAPSTWSFGRTASDLSRGDGGGAAAAAAAAAAADGAGADAPPAKVCN